MFLHLCTITLMSYRWAVNIYFFINGFVFANWASRLPLIQEQFQLNNKELSLILLAHSIGAFIAMPLTGWMMHRYSNKSVCRRAAFVFLIFFLCIPMMSSYFFLFLPFFFMGMGTGVLDVGINAQAVDVEQYIGRSVITSFHAAFSIGMVFGGIVGGIFTSAHSSLMSHFLFVGILSIFLIVWSGRYLYEGIMKKKEEWSFKVAPKKALVLLGIVAFCCMMGEGAISDWSTNYMKHIVLASIDIQTMGLVAFALMMTIGRLLGDKSRAKYGDHLMLISGSFCALIGLGLVLSLYHPIIVIVGFGLVGLGVSNIIPIVFSIAGNMPGLHPGIGIAMVSTIGYTGFMFGPPLIGFIADVFDMRYALGFLLVIFIIMAVLILFYRRHALHSKCN